MSAYIVDKATIDAIVTGYLKHTATASGVTEPPATLTELATKVGAMLWQENYNSVNARYRNNDVRPPYTFEPLSVPPSILLGSLKCYRYQSCEHDGWETSDSYQIVDEMILSLESNGINPSGWGISNSEREDI
jgi:hypothetical protein